MKRLLAALILLAAPARAQDRVTVLLDWFINPDHAPLVMGVETGIYARAGLDVRLIAPADPNDPPKLVAAKRGDIAVYYQTKLNMAVEQGLPILRVGTLVATPLTTVTTLRSSPVQTLADLKGRRVGYSTVGSDELVLGRMLETAGLSLRDVSLVNVSFALSSALMAGQVDAILGGFRNFELHQLDIEGRPGRAFYPEEHGVPLYDELIYVAHRDRSADPVLRRFMDATEAATHWLVNHRDEGWALFIKGRREVDNELNRRAWTDTLPRFSLTPNPVDSARYQRFAEYLHRRGVIRSVPPLDNYAVELPPTR